MKERPILFSAPMVRAILEGRKTQTRRVAPIRWNTSKHWGPYDCWTFYRGARPFIGFGTSNRGQDAIAPFSPYGRPGDRLWVKETFAVEVQTPEFYEAPEVPEDGRPIQREEHPEEGWTVRVPRYRSTEPDTLLVDPEADEAVDPEKMRWKPSIFMPRWASRLTLEVTDVRVQRVQEISNDDARAEGVDRHELVPWPDGDPGTLGDEDIRRYRALWNEINAKRGHSWESNPWVWAISFRRLP